MTEATAAYPCTFIIELLGHRVLFCFILNYIQPVSFMKDANAYCEKIKHETNKSTYLIRAHRVKWYFSVQSQLNDVSGYKETLSNRSSIVIKRNCNNVATKTFKSIWDCKQQQEVYNIRCRHLTLDNSN